MSETPCVLFFDVDGTLIWHKPGADIEKTVANARPSKAVANAFLRLKERGHLAFICTGRPLSSISEALLALEPAGIVSSAGACVSLGGRVLFDRTIADEAVEHLLRCAERSCVAVMLEGTAGDIGYLPEGAAYVSSVSGALAHDEGELRAQSDMRFSKFVVENESVEALIAADPAFFEREFSCFDLGLGISEMTVKGVDKGYGVTQALACLEHGCENTFAFGDSENDLPMAAHVETFVAMGNALPHVKAAANYVTDSVEHDGVVSALERFGLID